MVLTKKWVWLSEWSGPQSWLYHGFGHLPNCWYTQHIWWNGKNALHPYFKSSWNSPILAATVLSVILGCFYSAHVDPHWCFVLPPPPVMLSRRRHNSRRRGKFFFSLSLHFIHDGGSCTCRRGWWIRIEHTYQQSISFIHITDPYKVYGFCMPYID